MKNIVMWSVLVLTAILIGCGGSRLLQPAGTEEIPEWYTNIPQDPNYLFSVSTQTSQDKRLATDKATEAARADIGRQLEVKIESLQKMISEETGMDTTAQPMQMFIHAEREIVSTTLKGIIVKSQMTVKDGNMWRAYVLVQCPIGAASSAIIQELKNNNLMYEHFGRSMTFEELQDEFDKYEKSMSPSEGE